MPVVQSAFPCPPAVYLECTSEEVALQRRPPNPPQGTYSAFGCPYFADLSKTPFPQLDSDTLLYDPHAAHGLRGEFRRLFKMLADAILSVLGQTAQMRHTNVDSASSSVRFVGKLIRNLHHILTYMRNWQVKDETLLLLRRQAVTRWQCAHRLDAVIERQAEELDKVQRLYAATTTTTTTTTTGTSTSTTAAATCTATSTATGAALPVG